MSEYTSLRRPATYCTLSSRPAALCTLTGRFRHVAVTTQGKAKPWPAWPLALSDILVFTQRWRYYLLGVFFGSFTSQRLSDGYIVFTNFCSVLFRITGLSKASSIALAAAGISSDTGKSTVSPLMKSLIMTKQPVSAWNANLLKSPLLNSGHADFHKV